MKIKKNEKKILYVCVIILSIYSIYLKVYYNSKQYKYNSLVSFKKHIEMEGLLKGKTIDNIKITKYKGEETYLYNVLSEYSDEYYLIIISSIEACSTCREQTLNMWNDFFINNNNMPILLIVSKQDDLSKAKMRQINASIRGLKIEIPFYFDHDSILLDNLDISPYKTPLSIILSHDKKIIAIDSASNFTQTRTMNLKEFFLSLYSNGG